MKKLKHLLFVLFAVAMVAALGLVTACDSCNGDKQPDETPAVLQSIVLNIDNVKTEYERGELFVYKGLVVTAKYSKGEDKVVTGKAKVDSSAFNNKADGKYTIIVSYTEGEITKTANYEVTVNVPSLTSIELNTDSVKKVFYNNDEFNADGLVVTAKYDKAADSNVTAEAVIDSSEFDNTRAGTYTVSVSYTYNGVTKTANYDVTVEVRTLQSIILNTDDAVTQFGGDDEFVTTGLIVTARYDKGGDKVVTALVSVDSSAFNSKQDGTYEIIVSYTEDGVTKTASYNVTVFMIADGTGLKVSLADGVENIIRLGNGTASATIDTGAIVVKSVGADGKVRKVLSAGEYSVALYKGKTELTSGENLGEGVYQIWASIPYYEDNTKIIEGFVYIYVVNPVESIAFNSDAEGTLTEQDAGSDKMSSTWTFTAIFADGTSKPLTNADVKIGALDTRTAGEHTVKVTYSFNNILGETETVETEVTYNIKEVSGAKTDNFSYSFDAIVVEDAANTDKKNLTQADFTGVNAFLKVVKEGNVIYRGKTNNVLEFKNDALSVTFQGTGTLTMQVRSSSNSNKSIIGVKNAAGNAVEGKYETETAANVTACTGEYVNYYVVTGGYNEIVFNITAPGTYTICTIPAATTADGPITSASNARVGKIEMSDTYGGETNIPKDVVINIGNILDGLTDTENVDKDNKPIYITTANGELVAGSGIYTTSALTVDANGKKIDGLEFTYRIKLGGAGTKDAKSLKIITEDAATITVYAITGSSDDLARTLSLYDSTFTLVPESTTSGVPNAVTKYTFTASAAGEYYLAGSNAINLYYISVTY